MPGLAASGERARLARPDPWAGDLVPAAVAYAGFMTSTPGPDRPLPWVRTAALPLVLAILAIAAALVSTFLAALVAKLVLLGLALILILACGVSLGVLIYRIRKSPASKPTS